MKQNNKVIIKQIILKSTKDNQDLISVDLHRSDFPKRWTDKLRRDNYHYIALKKVLEQYPELNGKIY